MLRACACSFSPMRFRPPTVPPSGRTSLAAPRRWHRSGTRCASSRSGRVAVARWRHPLRTPVSARAPLPGSRLAPGGDPRALPRPDRDRSRVELRRSRGCRTSSWHGSDVANAEASPRLRRATLAPSRPRPRSCACPSRWPPPPRGAHRPAAGRLHVISAGVDMSRFHPGDRDVAAAALGWDCDRPSDLPARQPRRGQEPRTAARRLRGAAQVPGRRVARPRRRRRAPPGGSQLARGARDRSALVLPGEVAATRQPAGFAPRTRAPSHRCGRVSGWPSSRRSRRGGRSRSAPGQAPPRSCARV